MNSLMDCVNGSGVSLEFIESAYDFQIALQDSDLDIADPEITHHFAPNVYIREMDAKAGFVLVGGVHRHDHMNIIQKGKFRLLGEGGEFVDIEAPCTFKSFAGTKRVVFFLEDTIWLTVHSTQETDLEKIRADVIVPDNEVYNFIKNLNRSVIE